MPTYLFITLVLLAIYKSLSNRAALLPRCCLCPFAPYHTLIPPVTVILFRYLYVQKILATSVISKPLLTARTAQHRPHCINHGWNAVVQDQEAKQTQDLSYHHLIHSFRPVSNWVSARQSTKKFGCSRD